MQDKTVAGLQEFGKTCSFSKGSCICSEGEPGCEMYIVIQGKVLISINSLLEERVPVKEIIPGGFFGEMALFDSRPRSATCTAEEDTVCVVIDRRGLRRFIEICPDVAEKMFQEMSDRIRDLNNLIYKAAPSTDRFELLPFSIPDAHESASLTEPPDGCRYLEPFQADCPVCGSEIHLDSIKVGALGQADTLGSQRRLYPDFEPLWHYIWMCPHCGYANYYASFFHVSRENFTFFHHALTLENSYLRERLPRPNPFDRLAAGYYRAIHFNQCTAPDNHLLLGKLWLYLHWLYEDAHNDGMRAYTRREAQTHYAATYQDDSFRFQSEGIRQKCAMVLAQLYLEGGDVRRTRTYLSEVLKFPGRELSQQAYDTLYDLRAFQTGN